MIGASAMSAEPNVMEPLLRGATKANKIEANCLPFAPAFELSASRLLKSPTTPAALRDSNNGQSEGYEDNFDAPILARV